MDHRIRGTFGLRIVWWGRENLGVFIVIHVHTILVLTYAQSVRRKDLDWRTLFWNGNIEHYDTEYTKVSYLRLLHGKFVRRIKGRGSNVYAKNRLWVMRFLLRFVVLRKAVVKLFIFESFMYVQVILYVEGMVGLLTRLNFTYCKKTC
jgi:hypothetical protein